MAQTAPCTYLETFDQHTGGWWGWGGNHLGLQPLVRENGVVTSRSPWWIDYNHAPPGAGYIHMLYSLNLRGPFSDHHKEIAGPNPFAEQKYPLDFTHARVSVRVRGELELKGAQLVLLVQGRVGETVSGWLLTGQPIAVGPESPGLLRLSSAPDDPLECEREHHARAFSPRDSPDGRNPRRPPPPARRPRLPRVDLAFAGRLRAARYGPNRFCGRRSGAMKTAPGVSIGLALAGLIAAPLSAATDIGSRRSLAPRGQGRATPVRAPGRRPAHVSVSAVAGPVHAKPRRREAGALSSRDIWIDCRGAPRARPRQRGGCALTHPAQTRRLKPKSRSPNRSTAPATPRCRPRAGRPVSRASAAN